MYISDYNIPPTITEKVFSVEDSLLKRSSCLNNILIIRIEEIYKVEIWVLQGFLRFRKNIYEDNMYYIGLTR